MLPTNIRQRGYNPLMPRDKIIITFFSLSLAALVISAGIIILILPSGSSQMILHFTPEHGIGLLGGKFVALSAIFIVLVVGAINFVLSREIYYRERFLSYLIAFATLVISIFCLIAVGVIVTIN